MRGKKRGIYTITGKSIPGVSRSAGARETSIGVVTNCFRVTTVVVHCTLIDICADTYHIIERSVSICMYPAVRLH